MRRGAFLLIALVAGCAWLGGGGPGATINATECIVKDVEAGKSIAQVASDCGADVATVVATIIASADKNVQSSPAAAEVAKVKAALK